MVDTLDYHVARLSQIVLDHSRLFLVFNYSYLTLILILTLTLAVW